MAILYETCSECTVIQAGKLQGAVVLFDREHHLARLACGHIQRFVLSPIIGWEEWCSTCRDFQSVREGV